ncbi:MAG: SH3 domain-containing protein [Caldilinea sp.]|nr:SH3 domain-containing protein [Caldilinea sp.]MDW8440678.1 SH3 domain-containing protein [Caldilineaceae bacterium]
MSTYASSEESVYDQPSQPPIRVAEPPLDAHCYEIFDDAGKEVALLTLILDEQKRVQRAELYYHHRDRLPETLQAKIYHEARRIIATKYLGGNGISSPFVVFDGARLDEEQVAHDNPLPFYKPERRYRLFPFAIGYAAAVVLLIVFGLMNSMASFTSTAADRPSDDLSVHAVDQASPAAELSGAALSAEEEPTAPLFPPNTNGLPPSKMADNRLAFGMTVRIRPGLRSFVRSEPGPEAGEALGFLEDGATAKILGGPVWMQGREDTIVWWYVETEAGVRGWTPANTSELTLLEPVE